MENCTRIFTILSENHRVIVIQDVTLLVLCYVTLLVLCNSKYYKQFQVCFSCFFNSFSIQIPYQRQDPCHMHIKQNTIFGMQTSEVQTGMHIGSPVWASAACLHKAGQEGTSATEWINVSKKSGICSKKLTRLPKWPSQHRLKLSLILITGLL